MSHDNRWRSEQRALARQAIAARVRAGLGASWQAAPGLAQAAGVSVQQLEVVMRELLATSEAARLVLDVVVSKKAGRNPRVFYRSTAAPLALPNWLAPVVALPPGRPRQVTFGEAL